MLNRNGHRREPLSRMALVLVLLASTLLAEEAPKPIYVVAVPVANMYRAPSQPGTSSARGMHRMIRGLATEGPSTELNECPAAAQRI